MGAIVLIYSIDLYINKFTKANTTTLNKNCPIFFENNTPMYPQVQFT